DRGAEFEAIVGDGTLWVLLLAVVTSVGAATDPFDRDLLLTDVLDCHSLRSHRSAEQLAELCTIAQVQDRSGEWLDEARTARARVSTLRSALFPMGSELPAVQSGRPRDGDWLWNSAVGFARIEALSG